MPAKKNKGGRPKKDINWEQLKAMVRIQCTQEECAAVLGVDVDTLSARLKDQDYAGFSDFYKKYSHEGLASLRRAQWKAAVENNNPTMLVWMGKQLLGQKDKVQNEHTGKDGAPIELETKPSEALKDFLNAKSG